MTPTIALATAIVYITSAIAIAVMRKLDRSKKMVSAVCHNDMRDLYDVHILVHKIEWCRIWLWREPVREV